MKVNAKPRMKGLFITATGTGVGKTFIACAIARFLKKLGIDVGVMKPVASGGKWLKIDGSKKLISKDSLLLKKAVKSKDNLDLINPICFKQPLAPYSASLYEKKIFSLNKIFAAYRKICSLHTFTIVEGVGGVRVPLTKDFEVKDLILKMELPAIVIASAKLGTLNHTLLTLDYLKRGRVKVLGIILNFFGRGIVERTNLSFFKKKTIPILLTVPTYAKHEKAFELISSAIPRSPLGKWLIKNVSCETILTHKPL